jgi:hypothetical protein
VKTFLRTALAAAIGGAVTAVTSSSTSGSPKQIGAVALAGALVAIAHLFQEKPGCDNKPTV